MSEKNRILLLFFILSFSFSLVINELNLLYIKRENQNNSIINSASLVHDKTIYSIDNEWYLPQIKNYLKKGKFSIDANNPNMAVRRTIGYPLFYGLHYFIFGEKQAHHIIRFTQVLFFALSVIALVEVASFFTKSRKISYLAGLLYMFSPFIVGFNYYTITEAIHPSFVIFTLYFFSLALFTRKPILYFITGSVASLMVLIRPLNGILLVVMAISFLFLFLFKERKENFIKAGFLFILGFIVVNSPWTIRNYFVSGDFVPLEKYYYEDPMVFGKGQIYFRKWWASYENPSAETFVYNVIADAEKGSTKSIDNFLNDLPDDWFQGYVKTDLKEALFELQNCYKYKFDNNFGIRAYLPNESVPRCEEKVKEKFLLIINQYRKYAPESYYLYTPLSFYKELTFHSFSSMYASLNPVGASFTWWQIFIKSVMYFINLALHASVFVFLISSRNTFLKILIGGFYFLTVLFLCWGIRYIEARYILQVYPLMYISLATLIHKGVGEVKKLKFKMSRYG